VKGLALIGTAIAASLTTMAASAAAAGAERRSQQYAAAAAADDRAADDRAAAAADARSRAESALASQYWSEANSLSAERPPADVDERQFSCHYGEILNVVLRL
jgi:hypothetical protein